MIRRAASTTFLLFAALFAGLPTAASPAGASTELPSAEVVGEAVSLERGCVAPIVAFHEVSSERTKTLFGFVGDLSLFNAAALKGSSSRLWRPLHFEAVDSAPDPAGRAMETGRITCEREESYRGSNSISRDDPDGNVWKVAVAWKDFGDAPYKGQDVANAVAGIANSAKTTETLSGISGPAGASVTRVETTQRDLLGHVLSVTQAASGAVTQPVFTTTYAYNGLDKLTRVVQPGLSAREFNYDEMGVLRSETTPEAGTTTYARHNVLGNVLRKVLPDNTEVESEYDALGRLKRVFTPGSKGSETSWIVNEYDGEVTDLLGRATFQRGKLTQQTSINAQPNPTSSPVLTVIQRNAYADERDGALGSRMTEVKNGGSSLILLNESWRYNDLGLVETYSHPRRSSDPVMIVTNKYRQGQPTRVSANGLPVVSDVLYYPWGGVKEYSLGPTLSQGFRSRVTIGEDASRMPRPANIEVTSGVGIAGALGNYLYDSDGNIKAIGGDSYAYDGRSRLIGSSQVNPAGGMANRTYQYDDLGNMTHHGTQELGPYTNNRLPVSRGFQYDQRGNVTTLPSGVMGTAESLTWDPLDRIVSAQRGGTTWSYYYDSTGERIGKGNHGVTPAQTYFTLRNPANQIATEYLRETEPKLKRDNFFLGNLMVGSRRWCSAPGEGADDANWQYYAGDHLGSTWFTSVKGGEELASARVKYYPYGDLLSPTTPPTLQRHGFAGMEQDREELGYSRYQAHARSHEGKLGRFLSPDAVFGTAGDPDSWNRYSYCGGNPVTRNDPDGNVWKVATTAWKVGKAVYKGQDVANAVIGITRSTAVLFSMDSSVRTGARLAATGNLLLELSGANDVKSIAKAGVSWAKDGMKAADAIHNSRVAGVISVPKSGTKGASGDLTTPSGNTYSGNSVRSSETGGDPQAAMNPKTQGALDNVSAGERSVYHGHCCEIDAINKALNAGDDVRGAKMGEVRLNRTGEVLDACSTCSAVKKELGVE